MHDGLSAPVLADLRDLQLFAGMEDVNFRALMRGACIRDFPAHAELLAEGRSSDSLHILLSGSVDLYSNWTGRETGIATAHPVSSFILAAVILDAPNLMAARTLEKSSIALIPGPSVRHVFGFDGAFARGIGMELAQRYRSLVKNTKNLKLRTSVQRLANFLLGELDAHENSGTVSLATNKRCLAASLGMTPEHLSRAFRSLRGHGVTVAGARITVTDRARLEDLAQPTPMIDERSA